MRLSADRPQPLTKRFSVQTFRKHLLVRETDAEEPKKPQESRRTNLHWSELAALSIILDVGRVSSLALGRWRSGGAMILAHDFGCSLSLLSYRHDIPGSPRPLAAPHRPVPAMLTPRRGSHALDEPGHASMHAKQPPDNTEPKGDCA